LKGDVEKLTIRKKDEEKPYLTLDFECSQNDSDTLTESEWIVLENMFANHPSLVKIWAPYRDPELWAETTSDS
jgi:hypothetical protein